MKEKDLFKLVADRQLPDLEKIREACINQTPADGKVKKIGIKSTKFIAIAATLGALSLAMAVVFANPGGVFFPKEPAVTATEVTKAAVISGDKNADKNNSDLKDGDNGSGSGVNALNSREKREYLENAFEDSDFTVTSFENLGEVDGYKICYAGNNLDYAYDCVYVIGGYAFSCETQRTPYGLGLYAVNDAGVYTLDEAYTDGELMDLEAVAELVRKSDIEIEINECDPDEEAFRAFFERDSFALASLGEIADGELFFRCDNPTASGVMELKGYSFAEDDKPVKTYGLYYISDHSIIALDSAEERGIVTETDKALELIDAAIQKGVAIPYSDPEETETVSDDDESPEDEEADETESPSEPDETDPVPTEEQTAPDAEDKE